MMALGLAAAWLVVLGQGLLILGLVALVGKAGQERSLRARPVAAGSTPASGAAALPFDFTELRTGRRWAFWDYVRPLPVLVLFLPEECPRAVLRHAAGLRRKWARELQVLAIVHASAPTARSRVPEPEIDLAADEDGALSRLYCVEQSPVGLLIGDAGVVWARRTLQEEKDLDGLIAGRGPD